MSNKKMDKNGWTIDTYVIHNELMRTANEKFQEERDKRYAEGNELRAMALKIKETADAKALELASESQTYKEARNDAMREQNLKETGIFATRDDLADVFSKSEKALTTVVNEMKVALKPMIDHIASEKGSQLTIGRVIAYIVAMGVITGIIFSILNLVFK